MRAVLLVLIFEMVIVSQVVLVYTGGIEMGKLTSFIRSLTFVVLAVQYILMGLYYLIVRKLRHV